MKSFNRSLAPLHFVIDLSIFFVNTRQRLALGRFGRFARFPFLLGLSELRLALLRHTRNSAPRRSLPTRLLQFGIITLLSLAVRPLRALLLLAHRHRALLTRKLRLHRLGTLALQSLQILSRILGHLLRYLARVTLALHSLHKALPARLRVNSREIRLPVAVGDMRQRRLRLNRLLARRETAHNALRRQTPRKTSSRNILHRTQSRVARYHAAGTATLYQALTHARRQILRHSEHTSAAVTLARHIERAVARRHLARYQVRGVEARLLQHLPDSLRRLSRRLLRRRSLGRLRILLRLHAQNPVRRCEPIPDKA